MAESVGTVFVELGLDGSKFDSGLNAVTDKLKQLAIIAAAVFSVNKIKEYAQEATMLAARLETMVIVLGIIGKNAGYSSGEMKDFVQQVKMMGITTDAAQNSLTKMAQANLNLTKAAGLARVAQDAAVIGNTDSSAAFERLVYGIKTAQTEVLRTIGINVSFESSYARFAASLGKTAGALNEQEKMEARLNAVMAEGLKIQGAYEAAMQTTGKLINSLPRYFENVKEKVGELFSPALGIAVRALMAGLDELGKTLIRLSKSGDLAVWAKSFADGLSMILQGVKDFTGTVAWMIKGIWDLRAALIEAGTIAAFTALGVALLSGVTIAPAFVAACTAIAGGIYVIGTALAATNPLYAAFFIASVSVIGAYKTYKNATKEATDATYNVEEAMTRFNAKLSQMKFKPVDPDFNKEFQKELKEIENSVGKLDDKQKKALKTRIEDFYEGAKAIEKYKKQLLELDKVIPEKRTKANIDEQNQLKYQIARIEKQQQLAVGEALEAEKQKARNAKAIEDQAKAAGQQKLTAQSNAATLADMKRNNDEYFADRQYNFDRDMEKAKEAGESEVDIFNKMQIEKTSVAKEQYAKTMEISRKTVDQTKALDKYGFDATLALNEAEEDAALKLHQTLLGIGEEKAKFNISKTATQLQAELSYYSSIDQFSTESYNIQKQLWEKQAIEEAAKIGGNFDYKKIVAQKEIEYNKGKNQAVLSATIDAYKSISGMEQQAADLEIRLLENGKQERIDLLAKEIGSIKAAAIIEQQIVKQTADIRFAAASKLMDIRNTEINLQIASLDLAEVEGTLHSTTLSKRIDLTKELIKNQEVFLSSMNKTLDPTGYLTQEKILADLRKSFSGLIKEQKERAFFGGIKSSMTELADKWGNIGQQMKDITTKMFEGMEDALVSFVQTGKINFTSLANSLIADMIRIAIRAQITAPLMMAASTFNWWGLLPGNASAGNTPGITTLETGSAPIGTYHSGGIIGADSIPTRMAHESLFTFAPRAHTGIGPGEVPIVAQKGESVMTPGQRKDFYNLAKSEGGNAKSVKVEIINESGQKMQATNSTTRFNAQEMIVTIWLDALNRNVGGLRTVLGG